MKKPQNQSRQLIRSFFYFILTYFYFNSTTLNASIYDQIDKLDRSDLFYVEDVIFDSSPASLAQIGDQYILPVTSDETMLTYESYLELTDTITRYQKIHKSGGWPEIKIDRELGIGDVSPDIIALRNRLQITGDMVEDKGIADIFDIFVENGLKKFQFRHGIAPTGVLDDATMDALNIPVEDK